LAQSIYSTLWQAVFLNEFGYYTVFNNILTVLLDTFTNNVQEVDYIFPLAVGISVYDDFYSCMCAAEFLCALDVFARHTSSRITFLTLTIVGRSRGDVSSRQHIFQLLGFLKAKTGGSLKILHNSGCFCMVVQCSRTMLDKLLSPG
jgi:hypothetical protein